MRIKVIIERFKAIAFPIKLGHKGQVDGLVSFDYVDAQIKANNMVDILLDGSSWEVITLRDAIAGAIFDAYKK